MLKQHNTSHTAFTIQSKDRLCTTTTSKLWKTAKGAQKAADKANTNVKHAEQWKVVTLNTYYNEELPDVEYKLDVVQFMLTHIKEHLTIKDNVRIDQFNVLTDTVCNIIRHQPIGIIRLFNQKDYTTHYDIHLKYSVNNSLGLT